MGARIIKYQQRIPTGNPKRPWRYVYEDKSFGKRWARSNKPAEPEEKFRERLTKQEQVLWDADEIQAGKGLAQNPWHAYDVAGHTQTVFRAVEDRGGKSRKVLRAAAILHDIGKPKVAKPVPERPGFVTKDPATGKPYHILGGHEQYGLHQARQLCLRAGYTEDEADKVVKLVRHHQDLLRMMNRIKRDKRQGRKSREPARYKAYVETMNKLGILNEAIHLFEADSIGKGIKDVSLREAQVALTMVKRIARKKGYITKAEEFDALSTL